MPKIRIASYIIALAGLYIGTAGQIQADSDSFYIQEWYIAINESGDVSFQNEFLGTRETGCLERLEAKISDAKGHIRRSSGPFIYVYAHEDATHGEIVPVLDTLSKLGFSENTFGVLTESRFQSLLSFCEYIFEPATRDDASAFEQKFSVQSSYIQSPAKFKFTSPFLHAEVNKKHR